MIEKVRSRKHPDRRRRPRRGRGDAVRRAEAATAPARRARTRLGARRPGRRRRGRIRARGRGRTAPTGSAGPARRSAAGSPRSRPEVEAAVVVLADGPDLAPAAIDRVVAAWRESGAPLVAASYGGERGHPLVLERSLWAEIPDEGLRGVRAAARPVRRPRRRRATSTTRRSAGKVQEHARRTDVEQMELVQPIPPQRSSTPPPGARSRQPGCTGS